MWRIVWTGPWKKVSEGIGADELPAGEGPLVFRNNLNPKKVCLAVMRWFCKMAGCANAGTVVSVDRRLHSGWEVCAP